MSFGDHVAINIVDLDFFNVYNIFGFTNLGLRSYDDYRVHSVPLFVSAETFDGELTVGQRSAVVVLGITMRGDYQGTKRNYKLSVNAGYIVVRIGYINLLTVNYHDNLYTALEDGIVRFSNLCLRSVDGQGQCVIGKKVFKGILIACKRCAVVILLVTCCNNNYRTLGHLKSSEIQYNVIMRLCDVVTIGINYLDAVLIYTV